MKKTFLAIIAAVAVVGIVFAGSYFFFKEGSQFKEGFRSDGSLAPPNAHRADDHPTRQNQPYLPSQQNPSGGTAVERVFKTIDDVNKINEMNRGSSALEGEGVKKR